MTDSSRSQKRRSKRIEERKMMEDLGVNNSLINKLPDDCLKHIFSFLPILERLQAEKVCKRWRIIGEGGWHDIESLTINREYSNNTVYLILKRCGRFLRELKIYESLENSYSLSMIIKFCKLDQLEDIGINLWDGIRNDECFIRNLRKIFERTKKLTAVTIEGYKICNWIDCLNVLNPETLQKLCFRPMDLHALAEPRLISPDKFPNLKKLELGKMEISDDETKREEGSLKGLEKLELSDCYLPENFLQRIATFTNLRELILHGNYCLLGNEYIRNIAVHCTKLTDVHLLNCFTLTTDCFQYLGEMPSLEVLKLSDFYNIRSCNLMHLMNVKQLDVSFAWDSRGGDAVIGLIENSLNLEKMKLSFILDVDTAFVDDVLQIFHRGQRKKHLDLTIACDKERSLVDIKLTPDHPIQDVSYKSY